MGRHARATTWSRAPWSVLGSGFIVALLVAGSQAGSPVVDGTFPAELEDSGLVERAER